MSQTVRYARSVSPKQTAQSEAIIGKDQVQNRAGGYVFRVSTWTQFNRFLILGSEKNTYYATAQEMTKENAINVIKCIQEDGVRAVQQIVEVSDKGRAIKNDSAIFALALACTYGNEDAKQAAYAAIPKVCRIGTHLFDFCGAIQQLRGWSRGLRRAVSQFYIHGPVDRVEYQLIKYRQRNGWTHRDVLRLAHPRQFMKAGDKQVKRRLTALGFAAQNSDIKVPRDSLFDVFNKIQTLKQTSTKDVKRAAKLIVEHQLPREAVPTELLNRVEVWDALSQNMPLHAMLRNLGKMTSVGLLQTNLSPAVKRIVNALGNIEHLRKARLHPMSILLALKTYNAGQGFRGKLAWEPVPAIVDALDTGFYTAFDAVEPTGQNWLLALDVSGSMGSTYIADTNLTCREATAALALVTANVEKNYHIVGFQNCILPLNISPKQTLIQAMNKVKNLPFGSTDCAQPMIYARQHAIPVDTFVVLTDNETWYGDVHPCQALVQYRKKMDKPQAKLIVVGMTGTSYTIADPNDPGMLDVTGFSTDVPMIMSEFSKGTI